MRDTAFVRDVRREMTSAKSEMQVCRFGRPSDEARLTEAEQVAEHQKVAVDRLALYDARFSAQEPECKRSKQADKDAAAVTQLEADQADQRMKAVGSPHESGAAALDTHTQMHRRPEQIGSRRNCVARPGISSVVLTRTPQSCWMRRRKAQSVLDFWRGTQHCERERCDTAWTTDAEISAKYCAREGRVGTPTCATVVSRRWTKASRSAGNEGSQLHRDSCRAAGERSLVKSG